MLGYMAAVQRMATIEQRREERTAELTAAAETVESSPDWAVTTGDCLQVLRDQHPGIARLVFADPPYNLSLDYGDHFDDARPFDAYHQWCRERFARASRVLTADGTLWVLIDEPNLEEFLGHARLSGLTLRRLITWYETFGMNRSGNFNATSRFLLYCVKDPNRFVWRPEAVNRPSDRQEKYNDARANPAGKNWDSVWTVPRLCGSHGERIAGFPTQLPLALLRPIVGCASDPGDLVIDPFSGSGTTGAAALELGRRYLGIELSAKFAKLSRGRLAAAEKEVECG